MTQAEQKARETVEKFLILDNLNWEIIDRMNEPFRSVEINKRKERAKICVEFALEVGVSPLDTKYLNEVETAIKKI